MLAILVLAASQISSLASGAQIEIKYNWSVIGPGGHYGLFQYTTGPGSFDAHTALLFGARNADIPAPLFAVATCAALPFFMLVLLSRGLYHGREELRYPNHEENCRRVEDFESRALK